MDILVKAVVICIVGTVLAAVLKKSNGEMAILLIIAITAVLAALAAQALGEIIDFIKTLSGLSGMPGAVIAPVIKTIGIAVITELAAKICKDAGQSALASAVELTGTAAAVYIALPVINTVLSMLEELV